MVPRKAVIEVYPTNQQQIDAVLSELQVVDSNEASATPNQATDNQSQTEE
jgi:hypothetical protein